MIEPVPGARNILKLFREESVSELTTQADDILLYLIELRNNFEIRQSKSPRFSGHSLSPLNSFIDDLESDPEQMLQSAEERGMLQLILEDIVAGRILLQKKSS